MKLPIGKFNINIPASGIKINNEDIYAPIL